MESKMTSRSRRTFVGGVALGAAFFTTPGLFAEELTKTPSMTEGPFYPNKFPLDTDNDLLVINDGITPATGTIVHLTGKILTPSGKPVRNAVVEAWQVDNKGSYIHKDGDGGKGRDKNFQGFGRYLTNSKGEYYFRTIKPVPYPGRTPHIHFRVTKGDKRLLSTQCFVKGEKLNERDGLLRAIRNKEQRESLIVDFKAMKDSKIGELEANFDMVLNKTPAEPKTKKMKVRKNQNAKSMAPLIERLYVKNFEKRYGVATVNPIDSENELLIVGTEESIEKIVEIAGNVLA